MNGQRQNSVDVEDPSYDVSVYCALISGTEYEFAPGPLLKVKKELQKHPVRLTKRGVFW